MLYSEEEYYLFNSAVYGVLPGYGECNRSITLEKKFLQAFLPTFSPDKKIFEN